MAAVVPELLLQLPPRKEDNLCNARIRQKLKAVRKSDTRKNRGPLIAKHEDLFSAQFNKKVQLSLATEPFKPKPPFQDTALKEDSTAPFVIVDASFGRRRPDSPIPMASGESLLQQLPERNRDDPQTGDPSSAKNDLYSLRRPASLTTLTAGGAASRSRPSSPSHVLLGRRTPSPASVSDPSVIEAIRKRIRKVQKARLYLLQQPGPHSFTVGADSPEQKYKIIIGPQSCTCGKGPHCIHILFIMLRVFQVQETDSKLYCKHLKNYEVEELVTQYQHRRKKQVNNPVLANRSSGVHSKDKNHCSKSESSLQGSTRSELDRKYDTEDESLLCPICLLEMVEGESLVTCENGCHNKLHQHCIAIWAEECIRQNECILCPLCRAQWPTLEENNSCIKVVPEKAATGQQPSSNVEKLDTSDSAASASRQPTSRSSHFAANSKELLIWKQVFGKEFVLSLVSRNWAEREKSLKWLTRQVISILTLSQETPDPGGGSKGKWYGDYRVTVKNCCSIIACMVSDPVYKVYIASLRCLRAVLTYTLCMGENDLLNLQNLVRPIVKAILPKCANGSRRTSQLSIATLLEMSRGQAGSFGVGTKTRQPSVTGLGGVEFVLNCTFEEEQAPLKSFSNWQWLLGRLTVVERLIEEFPQEFHLLYLHLCPSNASLIGEMAPYKLFNYERLMMLLQFTKNAISHPHSTVNKMAQKVFLMAACLSAHIPPVFSQVFEIISDLDPNLHGLLLKKLDTMLQELQSAKAWSPKNCDNLPSNVPMKDALCDTAANRIQDYRLVQEKLVRGEDVPMVPTLPRYHTRSLSFSNTVEKKGDCERERKPRSASRPNFLPLFNANSCLYAKPSDNPALKDSSNNNNYRTSHDNSLSHSFRDQHVPETDLEQEKLDPVQPLALKLSFTNLCLTKESQDEDSIDDLIDLSPSLTLTSCSSPVSFGSDFGTPLSPSADASMPENRGSSRKAEMVLDGLLSVAIAEDNCRSQFNFPLIPGLRNSPDEELMITLQPNLAEYSQVQHCNNYGSYVEGIHWMRGPQLGTGAFSTCYQARDVRTGTLMAVKQVSYYRNAEEDQDKVMNEIREEIVMMAKLKHPNILRILGATEQGGHYNFFVEWMAGGSVASLLLQYGAFSEMVIIKYTRQVLSGLAYLHDNKILHRDLKGANLLLDSTGRHLRIADFGAAARLASKSTLAGEFQGQLLGTIAFMAPEVLRGEDYGRSCDVWSVGCVMIEMATTRPPWNASDMSNHLALIFKIACATSPPPVPDHLSPSTRRLALCCLELNSKNRPPTKELLQHSVFRNVHS